MLTQSMAEIYSNLFLLIKNGIQQYLKRLNKVEFHELMEIMRKKSKDLVKRKEHWLP